MKKRALINRGMTLLLAGALTLCGCGNSDSISAPDDVAEEVQQQTEGEQTEGEQAETADTKKKASDFVGADTLYPIPNGPQDSDIYVEPIPGLSESFVRGVDISSMLSETEAGVSYFDAEGKEASLFETLAKSGVNYIRVRVWNDPFDGDGNGYGGGNCNAERAAQMGAEAAKYGLKMNVDFHYSDFWADPNKQMCPKAWQGMAIEDKSEALYQYTRESLETILDAGGEVGLVQLGNEINNGMSGEIDWTKIRQLLQAGSRAVREISEEYGQEIQIIIHFTDISDSKIYKLAEKLAIKEIDYDIFGVSYYPYWHGTMDNLTEVLTTISDTYLKQVMVVENSYPYTGEDHDASGNSISSGDEVDGYPFTVQGQADQVRDVMAAVAAVGNFGIGYFYWEPAWIPVGDSYESNQKLWEEYGAGWASSYATEYDPKDAGVYYGGSSWDNQAMFDETGHPLDSINVFRYVYCGTNTEQIPLRIGNPEVHVELDAEVLMPETVTVYYNDRSEKELAVTWDEAAVGAIDTGTDGVYQIKGTVSGDLDPEILTPETEATVTVMRTNLLANASFEEEDVSMWTITGDKDAVDVQTKASDAYTGEKALHFWKAANFAYEAQQELEGLAPGTYRFGLHIQGGDVGNTAALSIYAQTGDGTRLEQETSVSGWINWETPQIDGIEVGEDGKLTVGLSVTSGKGGWGTSDDWYLYLIQPK